MGEVVWDIQGSDKGSRYRQFFEQMKPFVEGERYEIPLMGNVSAALKEVFGFLWVGFYVVHGEKLLLGPFQGPMACSEIKWGRGVCGTAWKEKRTLIVPDVDQFPGHIACSSRSRSEIVVPLMKNGSVRAVLDIDSEEKSFFDDVDGAYLEELANIIVKTIYP